MVGQILQSVEEKEVDKSENATSKVKRGKVGVGVKLLCIVVVRWVGWSCLSRSRYRPPAHGCQSESEK